MTYKQVKYFRRTPQELKEFRQAKLAFMEEGYDEYKAEERAWDIFWAVRIAKREGAVR